MLKTVLDTADRQVGVRLFHDRQVEPAELLDLLFTEIHEPLPLDIFVVVVPVGDSPGERGGPDEFPAEVEAIPPDQFDIKDFTGL